MEPMTWVSCFERYVDLDERWLFDLAKDPEGRKPL